MNPAHSMPSPVSPYNGHSKHNFPASRASYYPATPAPDTMSPQQQQRQQHQHTHSEQNRGLGLSVSMSYPHQSTISSIMASPPAEWPHSPEDALESEQQQQQQQQPAYSTSQPPDIFSAAFDPFSGFPATSHNGMVGTHSPEAPALEFCQSPPSSNVQSHRGSVSSGAPSEASEQAYTPRPMKGEDTTGDWYPSGELHRAISQAPLPYPQSASTLNSQTEDILYRPQPHEWVKHELNGFGELHNQQDTRLPPMAAMAPVLSSVTRKQTKRKRTTPEEATHECNVCGKLFKRSYNYKSHLDTHNPERKYPHPCTKMVGNSQCTKKFQRKTDLDRHIDSVHEKKRAYQCDLCGSRFARRDTLRRHSEDGCPKRFQVGPVRDDQTNVPPPSAPQPQRFAFPSPAPNFSSRPRSYSHAGPMAPPPPVTSSNYPLYSTPTPTFRAN